MSEERFAEIEAKLDQLSDLVNVMLPQFSKSYLALRDRGKAFMLPSFSGENSRAFVSWLYNVECYFENKCFSEKKKLELVVSCLKGDALFLYDSLKLARMLEGKGRIRSWSKLEMKMRLKYLPYSTMDELWAELKTLKQNSLSVIEYAKLFEELHFMCAKEVDSTKMGVRFFHGLKSEISKRINLRMMYPYGELFELALCVERSLARLRKHEVLAETESLEVIETVGKENGSDQGVDKPCLNLVHHESECIEPESIEVLSYGEEAVSHVPLPTLEKEQSDLYLVQVYGAKQESNAAVQGLFLNTYVSPLDLYINKRLQKPLSLKMDQFLTSLGDERCWSSSKNEQGECSYLVTCSRVPKLILYISRCPSFRTSCLGGITCALSTPHFHFYMLMRLQTSLVHSSAISCILRMKIDGISCSISKMTWVDNMNCFEKFRGFKYHSWVLSMLLSRMSITEMFILIHSRWKLNFDGEMNQFKPCCPVLKFLCFEVNLVQMHCEHLLEVLGILGASSLQEFGGVLALLVVFVLKLVHMNNSSPLIALLCSNGCINSYHGLSLGTYKLLVSQCGIIVVKLGVEPHWPFGEEYMDSNEEKTGMGSSVNVHFSILVAELLSASPKSPKQAIMVFDPGGRKVEVEIKNQNNSLGQARCEKFFFLASQI